MICYLHYKLTFEYNLKPNNIYETQSNCRMEWYR